MEHALKRQEKTNLWYAFRHELLASRSGVDSHHKKHIRLVANFIADIRRRGLRGDGYTALHAVFMYQVNNRDGFVVFCEESGLS